MGFFKFTDQSKTIRYEHESGEWIECRNTLSKGQMNSLFMNLPQSMVESTGDERSFVVREAPELAIALFKAYLVGWSVDDAPTVEKYLALDPDPAAWIDSKLFEHMAREQMAEDEGKELMTSPKDSLKVIPEKE